MSLPEARFDLDLPARRLRSGARNAHWRCSSRDWIRRSTWRMVQPPPSASLS